MEYSKIDTDTVIENLTKEGQSSRAFYMKLMSQHIEALEARLKEVDEFLPTLLESCISEVQARHSVDREFIFENMESVRRAAAFLKGGEG